MCCCRSVEKPTPSSERTWRRPSLRWSTASLLERLSSPSSTVAQRESNTPFLSSTIINRCYPSTTVYVFSILFLFFLLLQSSQCGCSQDHCPVHPPRPPALWSVPAAALQQGAGEGPACSGAAAEGPLSRDEVQLRHMMGAHCVICSSYVV